MNKNDKLEKVLQEVCFLHFLRLEYGVAVSPTLLHPSGMANPPAADGWPWSAHNSYLICKWGGGTKQYSSWKVPIRNLPF